MLKLTRDVEDAKDKLDHPTWKAKGSLNDEFACVTKELLDHLESSTWYSVQLILVWRASLPMPFNWLILVPDEALKRYRVSDNITDIVQIDFDEQRRHFTTTHFSLEQWTVVYYDSYLWQYAGSAKDVQMYRGCDRLVKNVRRELLRQGIEVPDRDPVMSSAVSSDDRN